MRSSVAAILLVAAISATPTRGRGQASPPIPEAAYAGMHWRFLGPFRGGRALAIEGIPGNASVFYMGAVAGGVWRTANAGVTWEGLTDDLPFSSVGAMTLAPSDPKIIYVGAGEADMRSDITFGDGMWKSADGGRHWTHLGLDSTRQIGRILVDPRDPNLVLVAALGHSYGPNRERGVYRSTDGGQTWTKVLFRNDSTGAIDLAFDPLDPHVVYAALWQAQRPPWSQYPPNEGLGSGVFKSTDEGETWTGITGHGLPSGKLGRIGLAVARGSGGATVYAILPEAEPGHGLYRSDDSGSSWRLTSSDSRFGRGWYFGQVFLDPANADVVYVPDQSILKSVDGGRTFANIKGAPGGDDYHYMWIDPTNSQRLTFASDQGVGVSLDGGATWSSWYNQPTAQIYHITTDSRWPYRIYGTQQDVGGTVAITSRSDNGEITDRDWYTVGAAEGGYIAIDPMDTAANIVYGGGPYGALTRFDRRTGQVQDIAPWPEGSFGESMPVRKYRFTWTSPIVFDPIDKRTLYFGAQKVLRTTDGGLHWTEASPDLTGAGPAAHPETGEPTVANAAERGWGVVYTIAPSPVREGMLWAGTDNGRIHVTLDGGAHWRDVTPGGLAPWSKISLIDASPLDPATAYAAIDCHRLDDMAAYIYRTHDNGQHWTRADQGIPFGAYVRAVRTDPVRRGLLYAGTELGVYVSFDDGDHWQSLQRDLPVSPVHDLVVHGSDLVVATHGRGFWLLDDLTPLRQLTPGVASGGPHLFRPETAVRIRRSENQETPLPPEVPQGENPPPGAIIDYWLPASSNGPVALDILDSTGAALRHYASDTPPDTERAIAPPAPYFMTAWLPRARALPNGPGEHRFVWDLRYARPSAHSYDFSISAIAGHGTVAEPEGPLAIPGKYTVQLTADGMTTRQPLRVTLDPRADATRAALVDQLALAKRICQALDDATALGTAATAARGSARAKSESDAASTALDSTVSSFDRISDELGHLEIVVETADREPTAQARAALADLQAKLAAARARWDAVAQKASRGM